MQGPAATRNSVEPPLLAQTAEASNVGEAESEKEEVFIAYVCHRVTAVFHGHATAIPVVGGLCANELQLLGLGVKAETAGAAEAAFGQSAIS